MTCRPVQATLSSPVRPSLDGRSRGNTNLSQTALGYKQVSFSFFPGQPTTKVTRHMLIPEPPGSPPQLEAF